MMTTLPVLVVGCGPAGLLSSILLSRLKVTHTVIEAREGLHTQPQAHVLKLRTMEIIREFGLDSKVIGKATATEFQKYVTWRDTLAGSVLGKIGMLGRKGDAERYLTISPTFPANMPQDEFEQILFDFARESDFADFRFGHRCVEIEQSENSVKARIEANGEFVEIDASFLVGADGVASTVRTSLGLQFEGDDSLQTWIAIEGRADLSDLVSDFPGVLHWICSPASKGVFIIHNVHSRFVFMLPYDPEKVSPDDFDENVAIDVLRKALGSDLDVEVSGIGNWNMSAQVAESYGKGRVFLVGDAAHRFPPTGGMGLNTGAQDVNNLMWKIHACLNGGAGSALLETYEQECRPVALKNCAHSKSNYLRMAEVDSAIFGPDESYLSPDRLAFLAGRSEAAIRDLVHIQTTVDSQLPHFDTTALDLGYEYVSRAIMVDPEGSAANQSEVFEFTPACRSGYRLPHMRLQNSDGELSSLDAIGYSYFTLFCASESRWLQQAETLSEVGAPQLRVVTIGDNGDYIDSHGDWAHLSGVGTAGAVLVRPDGQICWRSIDGADAADRSLGQVISEVLCVD